MKSWPVLSRPRIYRLGNYAGSEQSLRRGLAKAGGEGGFPAMSYAVLAMACQQQQSSEEAKALLGRAARIAKERLPAPESEYLEGDWYEFLLVHTLLREAEELISLGESGEE